MKFRILVLAAGMAAVGGCSSDPNRQLPPSNPFKPEQTLLREQNLEAASLYRLARAALDSNDFAGAAQRYSQLKLRYPFTDFAIQAQLEGIYASYRAYQPEEALAQADRFLRDYPRHEHIDYVQYLKGLINFERDRSLSENLGFDTSRRDVSNLRRSFDDFALLVQRFPNSDYVGDARARMIYLRNRIAAHELTIVDYYMRRGAFVAAAKRAEQLIAQYPGAPAILDALTLLEQSYRELDLDVQAAEAAKLRKAYVAAAAKEVLNEESSTEAPAESASAAPGFWSRLIAGEGYTLVIPSGAPAAQPADDTTETAMAAPAGDDADQGSRLRIYMESYDDAAATPPRL
ncbi:MAG: outer membrane protein assembly factor BamD [Nevskiales bacterium]|nr:outer membrane protein assembly factor BamD [Nevskiales bacterium]